jgi:hypothetical protein
LYFSCVKIHFFHKVVILFFITFKFNFNIIIQCLFMGNIYQSKIWIIIACNVFLAFSKLTFYDYSKNPILSLILINHLFHFRNDSYYRFIFKLNF